MIRRTAKRAFDVAAAFIGPFLFVLRHGRLPKTVLIAAERVGIDRRQIEDVSLRDGAVNVLLAPSVDGAQVEGLAIHLAPMNRRVCIERRGRDGA
jgi:hypothetical protein